MDKLPVEVQTLRLKGLHLIGSLNLYHLYRIPLLLFFDYGMRL